MIYSIYTQPANLGEYIPGTSVVPSYDLADPGHFVSRYKQELARRIVQMTSSKAPIPPVIQKACYVYIYIALMMSEQVTETKGYSSQGFSSCCKPYNSQVSRILADHSSLLIFGCKRAFNRFNSNGSNNFRIMGHVLTLVLMAI